MLILEKLHEMACFKGHILGAFTKKMIRIYAQWPDHVRHVL